MNKNLKIFLGIIAAIFIAGASLAYGALTAPRTATPSTVQSPPVAETTQTPTPQPTKATPEEQQQRELPAIHAVLAAAYPKSVTDYTLGGGKLYSDSKWFGGYLSYRGTDSMNRDTLRVLFQKKDGVWSLRTTPPQIMLSTQDFPDVPMAVLQSINKAVSLPAGGDDSPAITRAE